MPLAYSAMKPFWQSEDLTLTTTASVQCCDIFLGYLMADSVNLLWYLKSWPGSGAYVWHHGSALLCWGVMRVRGHVHMNAVGLLLCEGTAPFVNGRWFLATLNMKDGLLYMINGVILVLSFFLLRVVLMGWVFLRTLVVLRTPFLALPTSSQLIVVFGVCVGYPLQLVWFKKLAVGCYKVLRGKGESEGSAKKAT
jgi:hypothetical protein